MNKIIATVLVLLLLCSSLFASDLESELRELKSQRWRIVVGVLGGVVLIGASWIASSRSPYYSSRQVDASVFVWIGVGVLIVSGIRKLILESEIRALQRLIESE